MAKPKLKHVTADQINALHESLWQAQSLCTMIVEYLGPTNDKAQDVINAADVIHGLIEEAHDGLDELETIELKAARA